MALKQEDPLFVVGFHLGHLGRGEQWLAGAKEGEGRLRKGLRRRHVAEVVAGRRRRQRCLEYADRRIVRRELHGDPGRGVKTLQRLNGLADVEPYGEEVLKVAHAVDMGVLVVEKLISRTCGECAMDIRLPIRDGARVMVVVHPHAQGAGEGGVGLVDGAVAVEVGEDARLDDGDLRLFASEPGDGRAVIEGPDDSVGVDDDCRKIGGGAGGRDRERVVEVGFAVIHVRSDMAQGDFVDGVGHKIGRERVGGAEVAVDEAHRRARVAVDGPERHFVLFRMASALVAEIDGDLHGFARGEVRGVERVGPVQPFGTVGNAVAVGVGNAGVGSEEKLLPVGQPVAVEVCGRGVVP